MFLDTDILLALVKEKDWLKSFVDLKKMSNPKTSVLNILEAQLVLMKELGREESLNLLFKIKEKKIQIVALPVEVSDKATELLKSYPKLNLFDAMHAALCLLKNEQICGTDGIFAEISGLKWVDPRDL